MLEALKYNRAERRTERALPAAEDGGAAVGAEASYMRRRSSFQDGFDESGERDHVLLKKKAQVRPPPLARFDGKAPEESPKRKPPKESPQGEPPRRAPKESPKGEPPWRAPEESPRGEPPVESTDEPPAPPHVRD